VKLRSVVRTR